MEKYIVIVNQKYLVMVEANSHGGAEHRILDDIHYGIEASQAFTLQETSTECFQYLARKCETISFTEMQEKAKAYKTELDYEKEAKQVIADDVARRVELEKELERLNDSIVMMKRNISQAQQNRCIIW